MKQTGQSRLGAEALTQTSPPGFNVHLVARLSDPRIWEPFLVKAHRSDLQTDVGTIFCSQRFKEANVVTLA